MRKILFFTGAIIMVFMLSGYAATIHIPADYATIQAGIDAANNDDTVIVAEGTYNEHIDFMGKAIIAMGESGAENTIIDGESIALPIVIFHSGEGNNSILKGFTIANSIASGIFIDNSSPIVRECIIENNQTFGDYGAGIYVEGAGSYPLIVSNIIRNNNANSGLGGGICNHHGHTQADSNYIYGNYATDGSAVDAHAGTLTLRYNIVYDNHATDEGVLSYSYLSGGAAINNTIYGNESGRYSGGILIGGGTDNLEIKNNIIVGNSQYGIWAHEGSDNININYNCIFDHPSGEYYGVTPGIGNIYDDPLLADAENADFHLTIDSPCINTGDPESPLDPDGTIADMGALYFLWNIGYGAIAGLVTDEFDNPIEGAIVSIIDSEIDTVTSANGEYSLDSLAAPSIYDIFFSHPDYMDTLLTNIMVYSDETTSLNIIMYPPPQPGTLMGTVTNDQSAPLENVIVEIEMVSLSDTTGINGTYNFADLDPGSFDISFHSDNYVDTVVTDIIIISEETTELDVILRTPPPDNDVGVLAFLSPPDTVVNELDYPITAIVRNFGTNTQTFDVLFEIYLLGGSTPIESRQTSIADMPGLSVDTVTFSIPFASYLDTLYNLYCYTNLTGDENNSNDTALTVSRGITEAGLVYLGGQATPGMACNVQFGVNKAYVTDWQFGLQIFDVTDPANPVILSNCDTPGFARDIAIRGDYAYVADGINGVQVINIDDPANPFIATNYMAYDRVNCVAIQDHYLYAGYGQVSWFGMQIIDIAYPTHPQLVGTFAASDVVYRISLFNDNAYLAANSSIFILNIDDPAVPEVIAEYALPEHIYDVAVNNCYAYIANGENGLKILDVADPSAPVFLSEYADLGDVLDVYVDNGFAFLADFDSGISIIDITNPNEPFLATAYETSGEARRLASNYHNLYLADSDSLLVFQFIGNQHGSIDGEIVNMSGHAIDSMFVTVQDSYARTYSSQNGFYMMDGIPAGIYDISFSHPDYRDTTVTGVEILAGESAYLFMWIQPSVDINKTDALPTEYALCQNYPNPFNARTSIEYALPQKSIVQLTVYDIQGRLVTTLVNDTRDAGYHKVSWDTDGLTSGIYFYKLQAGDFTQAKKMVLLK